MHARTATRILVTALAAGVAAGGASAATSTTAVPHSCGTIAAAGKTWGASAVGVPCADAKALVRKLAPQASRAGAYHATYLGLSCLLGTKPGGKAGILCIGAQGRKSVIGGVA